MTKRYRLLIQLDNDQGESIVNVQVFNKTIETVQQLVRLSMSDMEKVDPAPPKKKRWGIKGGRVDPPIEPSSDDVADV